MIRIDGRARRPHRRQRAAAARRRLRAGGAHRPRRRRRASTCRENVVLTRHADGSRDGARRHHRSRRGARGRGARRRAFRRPQGQARSRRPARSSGGNLQKFVMGREIDRVPGVLVVNQPTWGVDAGAARTIRQALVDLARAGSAVLMISQDLDEIFEIADRVAVLSRRRAVAAVPAETTDRRPDRPADGRRPSRP